MATPIVDPDGFIHHSYDGGYIVLSYIVSLAGCWTSLELLHRRTGARGYYNWYLLLAAASTMGAVAIWCMHFIGNRAIIMDEGHPKFQIQYSPGFTGGSFFLPIIVVGVAFFLFSISENVSILGTLVGGLLTGTAVCGMHYMGQGGIANYKPSYSWPYVLGSAIIAVCATTIALGVFFYLKSTWTNSWYKRAICASTLAIAVSGMHWVATVGTQYSWKAHKSKPSEGLSREATVIVVICLSIGCCSVLVAFTLIGQRSRQRSADRAQQVVLACATYDMEGRLMVTPEGLLPSRKITDSYIERSFEDVFDVDHPVFCWIFRASRCWRSVANLVPGMRTHLRNTLLTDSVGVSDTLEPRSSSIAGSPAEYSTLFRELFCVAAKDLADMVQEPLEDIGALYGNIMSTGTLSKAAKLKIRGLRRGRSALDTAERGESPSLFGRGQLLFLVRRANRSESSRLQAVGHRFATISNVVDSLARSMEVTREELLPQLENMRASATGELFLAPGVHLACFALRPIFHRGFDVLVCKDAKHLLPTTFLTASKIEQWQLDILQRMDNLTVAVCCELLRARRMLVDEREHTFAGELLKGITQLAEKIDNAFFGEARLVANPIRVPANLTTTHALQEAFVLSFRIIADAHQHSSLNDRYEFSPLKFFLCQQHAYYGCPDNRIFARKIHREFAALAKQPKDYTRNVSADLSRNRSSDGSFGPERGRSVSPVRNKRWPARPQLNGFDIEDDSSSEKNLVNLGLVQPYGGIHVSNDIDVDVSEVSGRDSHSPDVEMRNLGVCSEVGVGDVEGESFADELVALTIDDRRRQRRSGR